MKYRPSVYLFFLFAFLGGRYEAWGQHTANMNKNNPLLCDPETGFCTVPDSNEISQTASPPAHNKLIRVIYYTDPICSACWGIEPQLRKMKLEYGHLLEIDYRMGGLLPDWSYNSGGISRPSDVADHWEEVSPYYQMPIDGSIWLEDPLSSSYPPSIAFKAAQLQDKTKAVAFLRILRENVFLEKKNITRWEYVSAAAQTAQLDTALLHQQLEKEGKNAFQSDLNDGKQLGVHGFPTLLFSDTNGQQTGIFGFRSYDEFEKTIRVLAPDAQKHHYDTSFVFLFTYFSSLTTNEFAVLTNRSYGEALTLLDELEQSGKLSVTRYKNGEIWRKSF